jgi:PPOX class probable F420-dependent enzyme
MAALSAEEARARFCAERVARLATCSAEGQPHLVPITFALLEDDTLVSAVDAKPKRTRSLRRLANIEANPRVSVLADHYAESWLELWWARADGTARIVAERDDIPLYERALAALAERYEPYRSEPPGGPIVAVSVSRWSGWAYAPIEEQL